MMYIITRETGRCNDETIKTKNNAIVKSLMLLYRMNTVEKCKNETLVLNKKEKQEDAVMKLLKLRVMQK